MSILLDKDNKNLMSKLIKIKPPLFTKYSPDFNKIYEICNRFSEIENFILIGRGGSVTSFNAIFKALGEFHTTKKVFVIDTPDPEFTSYVKRKCPPENSLVVVVSKSGKTIDVIENILSFHNYKKIFVTGKDNPVRKIAEIEGDEVVLHPEISGRFSSSTESTLLPLALLYIDAAKVFDGMQKAYAEKDLAIKTAVALYYLEERGYVEVVVPVYNERLSGFAELITQLMHETVCKEGRGQSFLVFRAPEFQHHTMQRIFGGRKNIAIITLFSEPIEKGEIYIKEDIGAVKINNFSIKNIISSLEKGLRSEYKGFCEEAEQRGISMINIELEKIDLVNVGRLIGFWQMVAFYSAVLRGVEPFTQPEVEGSKRRSLKERVKREGRI